MSEQYYQQALLLLDCLRLQMLALNNPPGKVELRAGEVAGGLAVTEDECKCGLAWVRIVRAFPTDAFPVESEEYQVGGPAGWVLVLEMGALRCAPVGTVEVLPSEEDWAAAVHQQMLDAGAMRRAVECCFKDRILSEIYFLSPWEERAPEGACMGGTQQVMVLLDSCDDCG